MLKMKYIILKIRNNKSALTLVGLVITIIVILILGGVTVSMLISKNGIITRAIESRIIMSISTIKEEIKLEQLANKIEGEEINPETLLAKGKVQRTVQQGEDGKYYMYYALKEEAYSGMQGLGKGNLLNLEDVFLIDDDLNIRYISNDGKEYGDIIKNKILEDETKIRFASKAFSEYISEISGAYENELRFEWTKNITSLNINSQEITELIDLVFFPNITKLYLDKLNLNDLKGIENCTKLQEINITSCNIQDFRAMEELSEINKINILYGDINIDNLANSSKKLKKLKIFSLVALTNRINNMKFVENLPDSIETLYLYSNNISKIEGLERKTNLKSLRLDGNNIEKIECIDNCNKLETLYLNNNHITDITPLAVLENLNYLDLRNNPDIPGKRNLYTSQSLEKIDKLGKILDKQGTINLDVDKLGLFTNYKKLTLSGQNLTTLEPLEGLTELIDLRLNNNSLTLEDEKSQNILKSMTNLERLEIANNSVSNLSAISKLNKLTGLFLIGDNNNVNLIEIEDIISNLNYLQVSTKSLQTIVNCNPEKITKLSLYNSQLTALPDLSVLTKLTNLNLTNNPNILDLSVISKLSSLETLNMSNMNLHKRLINFSKLTNLTNLNLSNNTLWSDDLENLKSLKNNNNLNINLSNNSIIDATALLELNPNTKIDLTKNINLSSESKAKLTEHFSSNVKYDK